MNDSKNKIFISGSNGFLGKNLIKYLKKKGKYQIFEINKKFFENENSQRLDETLKNCHIFFHLAGSKSNSRGDLTFNLKSTKTILSSLARVAPQSLFVFPSSFAVYRLPEKNERITEKFEIKPRNNYGRSKLVCEKFIYNFSKKNHMNCLVFRISNVYGPSEDLNSGSVISKYVRDIQNENPIIVHGSGKQKRDFIFVDDVSGAFIKAIDYNAKSFDVFNICFGKSLSIKEVIAKISAILTKKPDIYFQEANMSSQGYWLGDFNKAKKILRWEPKVSFEKGIRIMVKSVAS